jgi:hypothetical protein
MRLCGVGYTRSPPFRRVHSVAPQSKVAKMGKQSEEYLAALCNDSFLSFWSFANPHRTDGPRSKELCDHLVIFGDHVIIFSDKSCAFPDTGDLSRDWRRWYDRSIKSSIKQVIGAERWIREHPDRIFTDNKCATPLPVAVPPADRIIIHRIVVALGAGQRCRMLISTEN